jgi:phosphoribosylformylglycinamidine synthase
VGNKVPRIDDLERTYALYQKVQAAKDRGLVRAIGVPALGGLGVALARMAMASELGFDLDLDAALPPDVALFSESLARLVITVAATDAKAFEAIVPSTRLGVVVGTGRILVRHAGSPVLDVAIANLVSGFTKTLGGET